jgi:hypothetical protein
LKKKISGACLHNEHLKCANSRCTCICHTDPVLIKHFRERLNAGLHQAKKAREEAERFNNNLHHE